MAEILFSAALVLFSVFFIWEAMHVTRPPTALVVGPRTFPLIVGSLMLAISAFLLWRNLHAWFTGRGTADVDDDAPVPLEDEETSIGDWSAVAIVLVSLAVMFALLEPVGFIPVMSLFLFGLSSLFAPRRWRRNLVAAVGFSAFFYFLFAWALGIPLPKGILAPFLTMTVG